MEIVSTANQGGHLSKAELLQWINDTLSVNITKVEVLGTGSIYCQLLDVIFPGKVQLQKVNWKAKFEYEFVHNFKVLQQSFTKVGVNKLVEVEKLIKCKYQDNLEFLQWFKKFYDTHYTNRDYNALERRNEMDTDFTFIDKQKKSVDKQPKSSITKIPHPKQYNTLSKNSSFSNLSVLKDNESIINVPHSNSKQNIEKSPQFEAIKQERDFFFSKLKDIDHLLEVSQEQNVENLKQTIRDILYMMPEKVCLVLEDGTLQINNKEDNIILEEENQENLLTENNNNEQSQQQLNFTKNSHKMSMNEEPNLLSENCSPIKPQQITQQIEQEMNNNQQQQEQEHNMNMNNNENQIQEEVDNEKVNIMNQQLSNQQLDNDNLLSMDDDDLLAE